MALSITPAIHVQRPTWNPIRRPNALPTHVQKLESVGKAEKSSANDKASGRHQINGNTSVAKIPTNGPQAATMGSDPHGPPLTLKYVMSARLTTPSFFRPMAWCVITVGEGTSEGTERIPGTEIPGSHFNYDTF